MTKVNLRKNRKKFALNRTPKWLAIIFVAILPLSIILLQACSKKKGTKPNDSRPNIAKGFRAEVYKNGVLATNKFATGLATLEEPSTYAYLDVSGSADGYTIVLSFWSKHYNGIDGMRPATLDSANFGEPFFILRFGGESIVSGYIASNDSNLWWYDDSTLGTASGEILAINRDSVVGIFKAKDKNSEWEVRNCNFNLDLEEEGK